MADFHSKMGSVRHRLSEVRHDCNVVLVGDVRVGKSALVNRFINNKFAEVSEKQNTFFKNFQFPNKKTFKLSKIVVKLKFIIR